MDVIWPDNDPHTMKYTVYIKKHCPICVRVLDFVERQQINCKVINVDESEEKPPIRLMIFPALFDQDELLAYGPNIIAMLQPS